jgi:hypothetical protein
METHLLDLANEYEDFEAVIIVAGAVLKKESRIPELVVGLSRNAIRVDELAATMIDNATNGSGSGIIKNEELRKRGKALLRK